MSQTSQCTLKAQFVTTPVLIHLTPEHGQLLQWSVDGSKNQEWNEGASIPNTITIRKTSCILYPNHKVTITFKPTHPSETHVPFRVSAVTPKGLEFFFTIRCNAAPLPSTVAVVSPAFNRGAIDPSFMVGILVLGIACILAAIIMAYVDQKQVKDSKICKPMEQAWFICMFVALVLIAGFLAFWTTITVFVSKRPKALSCQQTKATVASGKCLYTYSPQSSSWDRFLCRVMGSCSKFATAV